MSGGAEGAKEVVDNIKDAKDFSSVRKTYRSMITKDSERTIKIRKKC